MPVLQRRFADGTIFIGAESDVPVKRFAALLKSQTCRCWESLCGVTEDSANATWQSAWRELEGLVKLGKIRSLGGCPHILRFSE